MASFEEFLTAYHLADGVEELTEQKRNALMSLHQGRYDAWLKCPDWLKTEYKNRIPLDILARAAADPNFTDAEAMAAYQAHIQTQQAEKDKTDTNEGNSSVADAFANAPKEQIQAKLQDLRGTLQNTNITGQDRYELRLQQREAIKALMSQEDKVNRSAKEIDREKIMAARLGITPEYYTLNQKGKVRVVTKDAELFNEKGELNEKRVSKDLYASLAKKYGGAEK
ncbi:MAG: hypothetical protein J6W11_03440 [Alphaproteobacteria bacterium]|nr:hypothetical protein [Alphaproteobacteria bacterium]